MTLPVGVTLEVVVTVAVKVTQLHTDDGFRFEDKVVIVPLAVSVHTDDVLPKLFASAP